MTFTPELKQGVEQAGDEPVRVEDPETHTAYLIIREDVYRRMYDRPPLIMRIVRSMNSGSSAPIHEDHRPPAVR